jgi:hypothetical protein
MVTKTNAKAEPFGLVGRCFHTFTESKAIEYQGIVRAQVGDDTYLVQYVSYWDGSPSTMKLFKLADMFAWQFYEDTEHMVFWQEHRYREPKEAA